MTFLMGMALYIVRIPMDNTCMQVSGIRDNVVVMEMRYTQMEMLITENGKMMHITV